MHAPCSVCTLYWRGLVRRARGYAPQPIFLRDSAFGPWRRGRAKKHQLPDAGREAFVSQHIGDLENLKTLGLVRASGLAPGAHPGDRARTDRARLAPRLFEYSVGAEAGRASENGGPAPSCAYRAVMAERGLDGAVVGLALDGPVSVRTERSGAVKSFAWITRI